MLPPFPSDTYQSHPAKWPSQVPQEPTVYPRNAHIHLLRHAVATLHVCRPDRSGQTVLSVVGHVDSFLFRIEGSDMAYRTEDFFFHAACRFRQPSINRRLHVEALVERVAEFRNAASGHERRAFFARQPIVGKYFLAMLRRDEWPKLCGFFQWGSKVQSLGLALQGVDEALINRAFDINSLRAETHLSSIQKYSVADLILRFLEVTVGEYDRGILAAEFKRDRFYRGRNRPHDLRPSLRLARKGHCVHIVVLGQKLTRRVGSETVDYVIDAVRDSSGFHYLGEQRCRCRSFLGRFHDNCIAARQRWSDFPRKQQEGKIPRSDDAYDAERLAHSIVQGVFTVRGFCLKGFQTRGLNQIGEDTKICRGARNIEP